MKALIPLALMLSGCATMSSPVSCVNAPRVRAAAALALQALERACPINLTVTEILENENGR